jgi:hypothetical protein
VGCPFLIRRIGGGGTIGIAGTLLQAGFEFGDLRLQRLAPGFQLLDDLKQLQDQLAHDRRGLLPLGSVKRQSCWKRRRRSHSITLRVGNLVSWCTGNAAFIDMDPENV